MTSLTHAGADVNSELLASGKAESNNKPSNTGFLSSEAGLEITPVTE